MDVKQLVILTAQVSVLCTVFGFGLRATSDDLWYLARRPGLPVSYTHLTLPTILRV